MPLRASTLLPAVALLLMSVPPAGAQDHPPAHVDHRAEIYRIIQSFQRAGGSESDGWDTAQEAADECTGMLRMFDANSAVSARSPHPALIKMGRDLDDGLATRPGPEFRMDRR